MASNDLSGFAELKAILRIRPFRRLWATLGLSALGDWLGLLATSNFAAQQVSNSAAQGAAFGSVIAVRLLPALILGPVAGVFADRFDRRYTIVVCDLIRFVFFASIPAATLVTDNGALVVAWAAIATFIIESTAMVWTPAKEAAVPNLIPRARLETANQLTLATTYGLTPVAAALVLIGFSSLVDAVSGPTHQAWLNPTNLALYFNALTFLTAAIVVFFGIKEISGRNTPSGERKPGLLREFVEGWTFVGKTPLVRGLVLGIFGAFAAGGVVVGTAKFYAISLGGGDSAFYLLFALLFIGLAARHRARPPHDRRAVPAALVRPVDHPGRRLGHHPGVRAAPVDRRRRHAPRRRRRRHGLPVRHHAARRRDQRRPARPGVRLRADRHPHRADAHHRVSSLLVGAGGSRQLNLAFAEIQVSSTRPLLAVAGVLGVIAGVHAFRQMDDKRGVPLLRRPHRFAARAPAQSRPSRAPGRGSSWSSRAARAPASPPRSAGSPSCCRRSGATWWSPTSRAPPVSAPASADWCWTRRATVARWSPPAPRPCSTRPTARTTSPRWSARRSRAARWSSATATSTPRWPTRVPVGPCRSTTCCWLSKWATGGLRPDLVVLLDIEPSVGLSRVNHRGGPDRLEAESLAFHERVRYAFLDIALGRSQPLPRAGRHPVAGHDRRGGRRPHS